MEKIFTWYFEQKGVENPERFLNSEKLGVNEGVNKGVNGAGVNDNVVPQTDISQVVTPVEGQSEQAENPLANVLASAIEMKTKTSQTDNS